MPKRGARHGRCALRKLALGTTAPGLNALAGSATLMMLSRFFLEKPVSMRRPFSIAAGLLVAMIINIFVQSTAMHLAISAIGVLLFAGLTAYDTQKIKSMYAYVAGTDMMGKTVIMGALTLYLDFINMFQFLLTFLGNRE